MLWSYMASMENAQKLEYRGSTERLDIFSVLPIKALYHRNTTETRYKNVRTALGTEGLVQLRGK